MLHLAMVRSPMAHARITSINSEAAKASAGVVAVYTGADLADEQGGLPNAWAIVPDQVAPNHPSIAVDTVSFAGEVVALIVARTAAEARDAVELVDVEYDELPVVLDLAAASKGGASPRELESNVSAHLCSTRRRRAPATTWRTPSRQLATAGYSWNARSASSA